MTYVSSDLHGFPADDFWRLLDSAGFSDSDELIVLGDVIDRNGDGGIALMRRMAMEANITLILGNHEAMLLSCSFLFDTITDESIARLDDTRLRLLSTWLNNGAEPTIASLRKLFHEDRESAQALVEYIGDAPLYADLRAGGRRYVLTHAGLGHFSPDKPLDAYTAQELLWHRPAPDESYYPDATVIFGHTPTQYYGMQYTGRMLRTSSWIDIDTGAAGDGSPMLLRLEDEREFYIK